MMKQLFMHYFLLCSTLLFISACQKEGMGNEDENPLDEIISETYNYPDGTIKMIYCPGGTFLTNEDDGDNDFEDGPELSCDPFWISETEVPNDLIAWIYNSAAGFDPNTMVLNPSFFNTEDHYCPV